MKNRFYVPDQKRTKKNRNGWTITQNIDAKYSNLGQWVKISINSAEKPSFQLQRRWAARVYGRVDEIREI